MKRKHLMAMVLIMALGAVLLLFLGTWYRDGIEYSDRELRWYSRIEDDGDFLVRGERVDQVSHDLRRLVAAVNQTGEDPESLRSHEVGQEARPALKLRSRDGRVVHVEVVNAEHLTQRMGTLGAQEFLATATFTLTEHRGVEAVHYHFEPGDHAMPGPYTRESFLGNWTIASPRETHPR
jgi:hypothetical protein